MNQRRTRRVLVVGAGVAGLSAAHYLKKRGFEVEILERESVSGGAVRSAMRDDKYLVEYGPNAFLASADPLIRLARELSIEPLIVGSDEASRKRYIYSRGRMQKLPDGPLSFLKSPLMSLGGKLRLMAEPFVRSKSPPSETLADFVSRRAGGEVLSTLVDPFVSGVWAGDAGELEAESCFPRLVEVEREFGSVMRGMRKLAGGVRKRGLFSFRWGMGTVTARLEEELKSQVRNGAFVEGLERGSDGLWRARGQGCDSTGGADAVVVAAQAHAAARFLIHVDPNLFSLLQGIRYASLAVVHTSFRDKDLPEKLDGFGVLVPRSEGIRLLGSIWSSSIFPGRCPRGETLLTNFIGGATDPSLVDLSDEDIASEVISGLKAVMGIISPPVYFAVKRWGQAIPQYTVGHRERVASIFERAGALPGLFLTGAWADGISVSDTVAHARATVDKVAEYLKGLT